MSRSQQEEENDGTMSMHEANPYILLHSYMREARTMSDALSMTEHYHRMIGKCLKYPVVILSAVQSVVSGIQWSNNWVIMAISLFVLILVGLEQAINPHNRETKAHECMVEFDELAADMKQYISANHRSYEDVRRRTETVFSTLQIWKNLSPPIPDRFMIISKKKAATRSRKYKVKEYDNKRTSQVRQDGEA